MNFVIDVFFYLSFIVGQNNEQELLEQSLKFLTKITTYVVLAPSRLYCPHMQKRKLFMAKFHANLALRKVSGTPS